MDDVEKGQNVGVSPDDDKTVLNFWEKFTYSLGELGVSLSPAIIAGWFIYYYTGRQIGAPGDEKTLMLVTAWGVSILGLAGRIVDSLADPLVGYFSDKWNTRWGRRMPWVILGTPFLALFSILLWFPPNPEGLGEPLFSLGAFAFTPNFLWIAVVVSGFWFFYTVVVAPYLSLLPEITPYNKERIDVSMGMAYNDVVGMLIGTVFLGILLEVFRGGLDLGFIHLGDGYKVSGIIIAVIFTMTFYISITLVREKPLSEAKVVPFKFGRAMKEALTNPAFKPYVVAVAALRLGVDIVVAVIPFMVINLMGLGEGVAGGLQGVIVIAAAVLFPLVSKLSVKHGKKKIFQIGILGFAAGIALLAPFFHFPFLGWLVSGIAGLFGAQLSQGYVMFSHCLVVMLLIAFPISTSLVLPRPIIADVMDDDEKRTGYRREAIYNGMEGLITKFAAGLAVFIVPLMNEYLGATASRPYGVIAAPVLGALFLLFGWYVFRGYPIDK